MRKPGKFVADLFTGKREQPQDSYPGWAGKIALEKSEDPL
jgi:hypothetical protein